MGREDFGLGEPVTTAIFRIVQEALTNIARHARASHAMVSLQDRGQDLLLTISDDGSGLAAEKSGAKRGFGLLGMRERVHMLGGQIYIVGDHGNGTQILIVIPRKQELSL
jgi:signal transduction histidine kinase